MSAASRLSIRCQLILLICLHKLKAHCCKVNCADGTFAEERRFSTVYEGKSGHFIFKTVLPAIHVSYKNCTPYCTAKMKSKTESKLLYFISPKLDVWLMMMFLEISDETEHLIDEKPSNARFWRSAVQHIKY